MMWEEKTTVQKGDIGENIVDKYLIKHGYIPYSPNCDGAHPFDRLCASRDKRTIFIADAKAKAKRKYYPDTGINIKHYNDYKHINDKYGMPVFIFFVDEESRSVYGNFLKVLEQETSVIHGQKTIQYPMRCRGIIYFPIALMREISALTDEQVLALKSRTTKKDDYRL